MATLGLHDMIDGAEAVDINDTVEQLDRVTRFMKDQKEIVAKYTSLEAEKRCCRRKSEAVSKNNIESKVVSHLAKKNKVANQAAMTVERERKEVLQLEAVKGAQTEFGKLATAHRCVEREDRKSQGPTCQL